MHKGPVSEMTAENLRSLEVEEETLAKLTPEFLNLKFQRQERIAAARLDEVAALAAYNVAVASLHRATGTGLEHNAIELVVDPALESRTDPRAKPDAAAGNAR